MDSEVKRQRVVASVNDDVITNYDILQKMRLLVVMAGIQPTRNDLPELQRYALSSLIDLGDAPSCSFCGSIMTRNGSCYRCGSCGSTSGCS